MKHKAKKRKAKRDKRAAERRKRAARAYAAWKADPSLARPYDEVRAELVADGPVSADISQTH